MTYAPRHPVEPGDTDAVSFVLPQAAQDLLETLAVKRLSRLAVVGDDVDQMGTRKIEVPSDALTLSI